MKKCYKLTDIDNEYEEIDDSEVPEEFAEGTWLDTGEITILLPPELAKCLEETGVLGLA
jgi:hypothetical protein